MKNFLGEAVFPILTSLMFEVHEWIFEKYLNLNIDPMALNDKQKRELVSQMIELMEQNSGMLDEKATNKLASLKTRSHTVEITDSVYHMVQAEALKAGENAQRALGAAYKEASSAAELLESLFGKDHSLIQEFKKFSN